MYLNHTLVSSHNPQTGRFDAIRLANTLGLSVAEIATIVGYTPRGIRANPDSKNLQNKLGELVSLVLRLLEELDGRIDNVRIWLHAPHPALGISPYKSMHNGDFQTLETLISAMEEGTPT
jgi:hypothetical protein